MEFLEPSNFHHFQQQQQHHHDQISPELSSYSDAQQNMHNYAMATQQSSMIGMPASTAKSNETKPRLGKDEVEVLEREFKKNPKPTTQTKRQFAEEMGVDLARINNWFQNRRAKRKHEKRQEAYEAGQAQDALGYSEPSSPDYLNGSAFFPDTHIFPLQHAATFPIMSGPPPPVAPYNPQYSDPSSASMESLQRTMAAAQAASRHHDFHGAFLQSEPLQSFGGPLMHTTPNGDRAQFPSADGPMMHFDGGDAYNYTESNVSASLYSTSNPSMPELHTSPPVTEAPPPFHNYSAPSAMDNQHTQVMTTFPSQLLHSQSHDGLPSLSHGSGESQSPEDTNATALSIGFKYDIPESDESDETSPPAPTIPFKSPLPMDIASRRKKVHVKPAALTADTLKSRPGMGPRTVSHAEGFRRPSDSPMASPMRRIASAGGNRNILTGRINKSGVESAQRSPINLGGFAEAGAFLEHNYQNIRQPPSLTAGSSLNSSLAPPTPMSPRGGEMILVKRENARSTASPSERGVSFVFNAGVPGCFTSIEGDQNLASPPETPHAQLPMQTLTNGWPTGGDYGDKSWNNYDISDEPIYTPAQEGFQLELHMPQPSYLSSLSQPVTPAFGQFNPHFMFEHESPQYKHESPQYNLSSQSEYSFPETHPQFPGGVSPMTKQKTFQFSNTTAADFSEK